ncbi:hypothetical protein SAMN04487779_1003315 [Belnapia rosea]|uniref:Uncharacterized protein n=2 Tax=Belnapia rosea TaxID=938405 RepID=A0A1G6R6N0_9PROT|nr:hypothetical protein SAMN04487779_1003315 [Belnapia rosea]
MQRRSMIEALPPLLGDHLYMLASLVGGIAMGFWFDLILAERGAGAFLLGIAALGLGALFGQQWAGVALGCCLAARTMGGREAKG